MSGTWIAVGRAVALGVSLALALLLLAAKDAEAGRYSVIQCGWHVGADAAWAETSGGGKFRPDSYCATPAGTDPFGGAHLKSFTQGAGTVSGTRFARWRWEAPTGTGITRVTGTWWQALHDGFEQRIGVAAGGFEPFATAAETNVSARTFSAGFSTPQPAIEDRLLCARGESRWCSLEPPSWSSLRALTITIEDGVAPAAGIGGDLTAGGWRHGAQGIGFWGNDNGSGVRFGETQIDGARVALTEYDCEKALVGGEWRGTRMGPCLSLVSGTTTIDTTRFSDGNHTLLHCAIDFAGNAGCDSARTVGIDNNAPAHPRGLAVAGGDAWRRVNDFDVSWSNPDQGQASPIWGAYWRIAGPGGYDSGARLLPGRDVVSLADRMVPGPGTYVLRLWLRDEAGNDNPASAVEVPLRFDDAAPSVAFEPPSGPESSTRLPDSVRARVLDAHSGPLGGSIYLRRLGSERWSELATVLRPGEDAGSGWLVGLLPDDLAPGIYSFRAEVRDAAGNAATTTRRADGAEMALRKVAPPVTARSASAARAKSRLFAHLRWSRRRGSEITVPFGAAASLRGRLVNAEGAGLGGRELRVVSRPAKGALADQDVDSVRTGKRGGFRLQLPAGTSRRVTVSFAGDEGLDGSRRPALALRVRGGLILHAAPRALRTGQTLHLWGRVRTRGAPLPRRGKLIAAQYYESASRRWRPVLVTRSDHSGRFEARYRFRYVQGTASIRMRALALAEERWPYAPGASASIVVRVDG